MTSAATLRPLALFGGTFDPVHLGHLRAAWEAGELLDAEVHLLPASVPPHRPQPVASPAQRVAMLRAALAGQQRLQLDTRELQRDGPSYSIDTLIDLREEIGPDRSLIMLTGADAFAGLPSWHRWDELLENAHIGVLTRPGHDATWSPALQTLLDARQCADPAALRRLPSGRIVRLPITPLDISASKIRAMLAAGRSPRYLLAKALLAEPALLAPYRCPHN
ncbi:MAG: nicotinate-nucleotide adenylyltransferase [Xanthomonadales bacterium]|nr:nicotinate-nucleotide adenylyltransferase [Xanthomonadales bacterium]